MPETAPLGNASLPVKRCVQLAAASQLDPPQDHAELALESTAIPRSVVRNWTARVAAQLCAPTKEGDTVAAQVPSELEFDAVQCLLLVTLHLLPSSNKTTEPCYQASERVLLQRTLDALSIPRSVLGSAEKALAQEFHFIMEESIKKQEEKDSKFTGRGAAALAASLTKGSLRKKIATGAGFVAGGALLGVTGGLAAPLLAPILLTVSGGALALGTVGGSVLLGTLFGLAGGGLTAKRVNKRVSGIEQFEFKEVQDPDIPAIPSLHATIVCHGILFQESDATGIFQPYFNRLSDQRNTYSLVVNLKDTISLAKSTANYTRNLVIKGGVTQVLKQTAAATLISAVAIPAQIWSWSTSLLDGEWVRAMERARSAGGLLADVLLDHTQGARPVMLVGVSFGALTVFECLLKIAEKAPGNKDLVYSATLISLPLGPSDDEWRRARSAVAGPIQQTYTENDWCLALLSRAAIHAKMTIRRPAGLAAVDQEGVQAVDVSDLVDGHMALTKADVLSDVLARCAVDAS